MIKYKNKRKEKLEYQLTKEYVNKHKISQQEQNNAMKIIKKLGQEFEILINCEYVWNVAEIFWIDSLENNNSIFVTLKFLDVMDKFRSPSEYDISKSQLDSDNYWKILYKNAIYGKLDIIIKEIEKFPNDKISAFSKKKIKKLCIECPLFRCLNEEQDEEEIYIPRKDDIIEWKQCVHKTMNLITEKHRLLPLLQIFIGNIDVINCYINDNWLDWICGYLFYNSPWIDHKNELRSLLTLKTAFNKSEKGSIEWMFGCIMTKEYQSILYYVNARFPKWFGPHLCYFLRRLNTNLIMKWPREKEIELLPYNNDYNKYIENHTKMTIIEWIFEYYVEDLLFINNNAWQWLKNYLYFFKRRGLSMLSLIFENIYIKNDKMAYLMLQCCDEFNLNDNIYNMICLKMAHKSYINEMEYGRITYWCCKCRKLTENNEYLMTFNKYLSHLIENYLNHPEKYINTLHDVCDNANIDELDSENDIKNCKLLLLLSKLRDMYLCRFDLQKLDIEFNLNKQEKLNKLNKTQQSLKTPKPATPFTSSRGFLIDALSKSVNKQNKNLKKISDSFDIALDIDNDHKNNNNDNNDIESSPAYPKLNGRRGIKMKINNNNLSNSDNESSMSYSSPFPKSVLKRNKQKKEEKERASADFLLSHLKTPPRPTPSRNGKHSHRKSSHKKSTKSSVKNENKARRSQRRHRNKNKYYNKNYNNLYDDESKEEDERDKTEINGLSMMDEFDESDDLNEEELMDEDDKNYMIECCDIIVSYIKYLMDIINDKNNLYDLSYFIRIILFSLPMFAHKYSPNAITVNEILSISHKWYKIKFTKNKNKTGIKNFSKNHELQLIQIFIAQLQSKVLATTYSNQNYAHIWQQQEQQGMDQDHDDDNDQDQEDEEQDDDMIDID